MKKARRASKQKTISPGTRPQAKIKMKLKAKAKSQPSRKTNSKLKAKTIIPKDRFKIKVPIRRPVSPRQKEIIAAIEPLSILQTETPADKVITDLPFSYNKTQLTLMVRDPYWAYAYWDFSLDTWNWIVVFRERDHGAKPKLRIHNLDTGECRDLDIFLDARNWYLELGAPFASFQVELGLLDSSGNFHVIIRSNRVQTPRNGPSDKMDDAWNSNDLEFAEIYRLSGGGKTGHGSEIFSSLKRRSS